MFEQEKFYVKANRHEAGTGEKTSGNIEVTKKAAARAAALDIVVTIESYSYMIILTTRLPREKEGLIKVVEKEGVMKELSKMILSYEERNE